MMSFAFDQARNFTALVYICSSYTRISKLTCQIQQAGTWALENPALAACAVVGTGGVAVVASPALVTTPFLSSLGFNAAGVAAGIHNLQKRTFNLRQFC